VLASAPVDDRLGSQARPLSVAVVGSGPAGFYASDLLLKSKDVVATVDMFERLPAPFGLVRFGVAPDHQRIKLAAKAFERTASSDRFRFFGNVRVGIDVSSAELRDRYDQVLYAVGSATDRRLGVVGEDLRGSHAATAFVGWYNGHPDFIEEKFELDCERVVVVGVGNVAMDVTRVLVRDTDELAKTDITDYALQALKKSAVREVVLLGRRGPAQAAFDQGELQDIVELSGVQVVVDPEPVRQAAASLAGLNSAARKNIEYLMRLADAGERDAPRRVRLRFLSSPLMLLGDGERVSALRIEKNRLVERNGRIAAEGTGEHEDIECGLVMRSIGYHGVPLPGLPFDERNGVVPNVEGRVTEGVGGEPLVGLYVVGWIKRGPTGLIGTNKSDAKETTDRMLEDARRMREQSAPPRAGDIAALLAERSVRFVTFPQWRVLDEMELLAGQKLGKVREKFHTIESMLAALESSAR
jgi:ferredoxin--NADP+ reductase